MTWKLYIYDLSIGSSSYYHHIVRYVLVGLQWIRLLPWRNGSRYFECSTLLYEYSEYFPKMNSYWFHIFVTFLHSTDHSILLFFFLQFHFISEDTKVLLCFVVFSFFFIVFLLLHPVLLCVLLFLLLFFPWLESVSFVQILISNNNVNNNTLKTMCNIIIIYMRTPFILFRMLKIS